MPKFVKGDRVKVNNAPRNQDWMRRYEMYGTLVVSDFDGVCYYFLDNKWKASEDRLEYANDEVPW